MKPILPSRPNHSWLRRRFRDAQAQFLGTEAIGVAPGRALGGVAELLERVRKKRAGRGIVGIGEHEVADGLRHETEFALGEVSRRALEDRVGAAHVLDILPA